MFSYTRSFGRFCKILAIDKWCFSTEGLTMRITQIKILCVIIVLAGALSAIPAMAQKNDGHIVWSQSSLNRYSLKMSIKRNNQWSTPEIIEESDNPIIVPALSVKQGGDIYAAWTELNGVQGRIRYKIKHNGAWESTQELNTSTSSDMAPAIIIDSFGIPWLVWSGTDETDDDIYFSRWIGNQWQPPERVNDNDKWPDILPSIAVDSRNRITATWLGYNGKRYLKYSCYLTGKNWSRESVVGEIPDEAGLSDQELPNFIPEGSQGSLRSGESKPIHKFVKSAPIR